METIEDPEMNKILEDLNIKAMRLWNQMPVSVEQMEDEHWGIDHATLLCHELLARLNQIQFYLSEMDKKRVWKPRRTTFIDDLYPPQTGNM